MAEVAIVRCESYDYDAVKAAVEKGLDLIGGPGRFMKPGERILLKPNLLSADPPERCTTTHPAVFQAVAEALQRTGVTLSYGDSPGIHSPEAASKKAGLAEAAARVGIPMADFHTGEEVHFHEGVQNKRFIIAKGVLENDGLVSLPKLKTHGFARMTGCIKNQFGCIPGPLKGEFHVRIPDANDFARMLVDLNLLLKPRLFIMDGIYAMEGNGPRGGRPKRMNVLLFSSDPIALDAVVCKMINLDPRYVPTIKFGKEAGLGTWAEQEITLLGDDLRSFFDPGFDVRREPVKPYKPCSALRYLRNAVVPKPYITEEKCVRCGACVKACPVNPKVVNWHDGDRTKAPSYQYSRCIRCYCCQELCPESAVDLKVPLVRRLFPS